MGSSRAEWGQSGLSGAKKGQVGLRGAKQGLARLWSQAGLSMLRGPSGTKLGLAGPSGA